MLPMNLPTAEPAGGPKSEDDPHYFDFYSADDADAIVVNGQRAIAIYRNGNDDLIILQDDDNEHRCVVVLKENELQLARALCREVGLEVLKAGKGRLGTRAGTVR